MIESTLYKRHPKYLGTLLSVIAAVVLAACSSDVRNPDSQPPATVSNSGSQNPNLANPQTNNGSSGNTVDNEQYRVDLSATQFNLTEGLDKANINLTLVRENGHSAPVSLALRGQTTADEINMRWQFSDFVIDGAETSSNLQLELGVARGPIQAQTRRFVLTATDGNSSPLDAEITLSITPTAAPDVYLQIGQSNMVGFSLPESRESGAGQPDAPNTRIIQLNVTGNDSTNFPSPAAFSNPENVANPGALTVTALDPLHDGFDFSINSKENARVGLGLSFAKAMLPMTTANVVLVPAAWSDTGFCKTDTNLYPGVGWNASPPADTQNFAGTLLHDRALTRLNLALETTGGIFRGMVWHQGEADSNDAVCAEAYETNLKNLVASLRSRARVDARGQQARGAAADIPFIAGTMSRGGEFADFWAEKEIVDNVHKQVPAIIPFASVVNNDDLVPPAYPCGQGGCIHFGAVAYREMGARYANRMQEVHRR